jgi:hypothetical protein
MIMENVKTYLFIAAAIVIAWAVGCTTLKPEVKTTHNININHSSDKIAEITTTFNRKAKTVTAKCIPVTCDSCIPVKFKYAHGEKVTCDSALLGIGNYAYWAGESCREINRVDSHHRVTPDFTKINGLLGWNIPFGDIKVLLDKYNSSNTKKNTDSVGFAVYITLQNTRHLQKDSSINDNINSGMKETHLLLVLTVGRVEKPEFGYRDLITPCPNMCDGNSTLAAKYKEEYRKGYYFDSTQVKSAN